MPQYIEGGFMFFSKNPDPHSHISDRILWLQSLILKSLTCIKQDKTPATSSHRVSELRCLVCGNEFLHEEIETFYCSEKSYGWWWHSKHSHKLQGPGLFIIEVLFKHFESNCIKVLLYKIINIKCSSLNNKKFTHY